MNSSLYIGKVAHIRSRPRVNTFRYGIYYLFADIDELDELDERFRWFGHNRAALVSLPRLRPRARDGEPSLRMDRGDARPRRHRHRRRAASASSPSRGCSARKFYPVSFWYCYHADGTVRAVLAEVQNTFRDHHNYLLHNEGEPFDFSVKTADARRSSTSRRSS